VSHLPPEKAKPGLQLVVDDKVSVAQVAALAPVHAPHVLLFIPKPGLQAVATVPEVQVNVSVFSQAVQTSVARKYPVAQLAAFFPSGLSLSVSHTRTPALQAVSHFPAAN